MKHTASVITISDMGARGERIDTSGPALCQILKEYDWDVVYKTIIPDEKEIIKKELMNCCDEKKINLVVTTGGTGFSPRDITPEATLEVIEKNAFGISEAMRAESMKITKKAFADILGKRLVDRIIFAHLEPGFYGIVLQSLTLWEEGLASGLQVVPYAKN